MNYGTQIPETPFGAEQGIFESKTKPTNWFMSCMG